MPRGRIPVKSLHPPVFVAGDDQKHPGVAALERAIEAHREPALGARAAGRRLQHLRQLRAQAAIEALLGNHLGGDAEVLRALHGLTQVAVLAPDHVERRHVDDHVAPDRHRPQRLAERRRVGPQIQPLPAAAKHDQPPAAAVTHGGEVGDKLGEAGFVADRVAGDHRVAHPRAVGDGRRAVGVEVIALHILHGERRERVTFRHVHQSPNPGQVSGIRLRSGRPHQQRRLPTR